MNAIDCAVRIAKEIKKQGGCTYYVGGYVRDRLLGLENKDVDIEVHGVSQQELEGILDSVGTRLEVGKSFGIYQIKGCSLDIALPRSERVTGGGHRDFEISVDPHLGTRQAALRRDFTVNGMMMDVLTGEVVDHFHGKEDLKQGILRHINDKAFAEDPLRVFRGAQFGARFQFTIAEETVLLCRGIEVGTLSCERVFEELSKALMKAEKPSLFFEALRKMNQLGVWFPEVEQLIGVKQNPAYHAEGDVWNHTMMVLDEAAEKRENVKNPLGFMLSALVHDFGKILCTEEREGVIHAYGHETQGLPLIRTFLQRLTRERNLIRYVLNLSELHMKPNIMAKERSSVKATNKLFDSASEPYDLIAFALCDHCGKLPKTPVKETEDFLLERLAMFEDVMQKPYVQGRDLIEHGLTPDDSFSELLEFAHKLRLAGVCKEDALRQTLSLARKGK